MSLSKGEQEKMDGVCEKDSTPEEPQKDILPGYANFDDYVKEGFNVIKAGIKAANSLPSGANFNYYACFPTFNAIRGEEAKKMMNIMQEIIECTGAAGSIQLRDEDEKFDLLAEANDILLDRANVCMDKEDGIQKKPTVELVVTQTRKNNYGSWNTATTSTTSEKPDQAVNTEAVRLLAGKNVQRPQLSFKDKIDNSLNPWEPKIKEKPNALKPLGIYLIESEHGEAYCHPYEFELDKFSVPDKQLVQREPIKFKTLEETPLIVIERPEDLKILLNDLLKYDEIAIDLEHHSYRTFQGITCLMQISTRDTDFLVDTLTLRSELHILNEVFTKPTILKVFHGADSDIQWLQRDLSLYIVNMFDTHQAAKHLNLPFLSLAYLLKTHCNVDPNKHFQLADWRMRPLPEELMKYAREDTHYLLYIKDIMRNQLINFANGQTNILKAVYDRSTEICKTIYEKPICSETSYMNVYRKSRRMFNNRQLSALKELFIWRDTVARQEDDSSGYVLPNHMMLNIAESLPREMQGILASCNPIPPLVRQHLLKLHKIVLKARDQPLIKPVLEQDIRQRLNQRNQAMDDDIWIWSPHDIPNGMEVQVNLPCLLDSSTLDKNLLIEQKIDHSVTIFDSPPTSEDENDSTKDKLKKAKKTFVSPFERYKLVFPMVAAEEEQERVRKELEQKEKEAMAQKLADETAQSIGRVHEHFVKITQNISKTNNIDAMKKTHETISTMSGIKKRKCESTSGDKKVIKTEKKFDASTPMPASDTTIVRELKRRSQHDEETDDDDVQPIPKKTCVLRKGTICQLTLGPYSGQVVKPKLQKKENLRELQAKGMLPQVDFDYKSVDFSSFQGGSKNNPSKAAPFQQKKYKDKVKKGRRKKEKIGI